MKDFLGGERISLYTSTRSQKRKPRFRKNAPSTSIYTIFSNSRKFSKSEEDVHAYLKSPPNISPISPFAVLPFHIS